MSDDFAVVRRRALKHAGMALLGAVVLIVGVLAFEDSAPPAAPQPPAPAAVGALVPAPTVPPVVLPAPTEAGGTAPSLLQPIVGNPVAPAVAPAAAAPVAAEVAKDEMPQPASAPVAVAVRKVEPPLANGYLVQLGVFSAMDNAEGLRSDVAARGLPAHVEGRVVVGPFSSKAEAEAARAKLKRAGMNAGIVVPPRKDK